jgi:uncharacterized membrane protein YjgN (DUF898 family)
MDEPFEYTGTGGEKFRGFVIAMLLILAIFGANFGLHYLTEVSGVKWLAVLQVILGVGYAALFGAATYAAQRYRLSRTLWRGIGGAMEDGAIGFGLKTVWYGMLTGFTLGLARPILRMRLAERRINASAFGSLAFAARGRGRALYPAFLLGALALLAILAGLAGIAGALIYAIRDGQGGEAAQKLAPFLGVPLLALAFPLMRLTGAWVDAALARELLSGLRWGDMRFATGMTGRDVFRLRLGNMLIQAVTFGLGQPYVADRSARFLVRHVQARGSLDAAALRQTRLEGPRRGEGLMEILDVGLSG